MERSLRVGSAVFAAGMGAMGVLTLVRLDVPPALLPISASVAGQSIVAGLWGALLVASAMAVLFDRRARTGAVAIATLLSLGALLHVRPALMNPGTPAWAVAFEAVVLAAAAWTLAGLLGPLPPAARLAARWAFGASLIAFGLFHFLYHAYIEAVVPSWIPGHKFWTYAIGVALVAAGLAILTRIRGILAATLLSIMFGSWVFIVHAPRVAGSISNANEWSSMIIALACCGGSWIMRESLSPNSVRETSIDYITPALASALDASGEE